MDKILPNPRNGLINVMVHLLHGTYTTVKKWYVEFKPDRTSTNNTEFSSRPNEVATGENIKKVHRIVLNDRKIKLSVIADMVNISTECVRHILHEYLSMKKLSARWVPRSLTIYQKQQFVTIYGIWIHYYITQFNRQSTQ